MKIQSFAKTVGDNGCLALCYLYIACEYTNTQWNDFKAMEVLKKAMELGYISKDCYVKNPVALMRLAVGGNFNVRKCHIKDSRGMYVAVRYEYFDEKEKKNYAHWAVWDIYKGMIWDSLEHSNCIDKGKPNIDDVREVVIL